MPTSSPIIETARLQLRPLSVDDAEEMAPALADPALYRFIGGAPPSPGELREVYGRWIAGPEGPGDAWHNWAVRLATDGTLIGHVQATVVDGGERADIAWILGTPWHGRGYATEAAIAMVRWLETDGVRTITAHVDPRHGASARVAERVGLEPTDEVEGGEVVWRRDSTTTRRSRETDGMPEREPKGQPTRQPCSCGCVNTFSTKDAESDLDSYHRDGVGDATQALIDAIRAEGIDGATLLDVGGGVGAIQLELLAAGLASAESVDASEGYVAVARAEAARRGFAERTSHRFGTLADLAESVGPADIVTLDKVVCCNADLPLLLGDVVLRARRMVGLVYPRERWWNAIAAAALAAWGWLTRSSTRWYLHSDAEIDGILRSAGFERREVHRTLLWQVALYVRPDAQASFTRGG